MSGMIESKDPVTTTENSACEPHSAVLAEAHVPVIRVGESVWSTWEPEDGRFNLEWLGPVLNGAHERGISVILGTPTYAVPPWLARLYPEIAGKRSTGVRIPWGARQLTGDTTGDHLSDPSQAARQHPVLVVAGPYMAEDPTLDWLVAYAAAGGHLILGPQSGYADHEERARAERQPARIASAAGAWFDEFSNLSRDLPVTSAPDGELALPPEAAGTRWLDGLQLSGAQELAHYQHPHFGPLVLADEAPCRRACILPASAA